MSEDERKKRRKSKKKSRRVRSSDALDVDEEAPLPVEQGEAEFANIAAINADNELVAVVDNNNDDDNILVVDANGDEEIQDAPVLAAVQDDMEDAIPAPIVEPELNGEVVPEFTEDGLAVAMAVDTAAEDEYIYSAIEYDPDSKPPLHRNRRFRVYTCMAFLVVIAVVVLVVVYVTKSAKGTDVNELEQLWGGEPSQSPTPGPTTNREASGVREQIEAGVLQRGVNFTDMDRNDPRYLALDWILHYDQLKLDSDDKNLYQRYVLALLAFTLDSLAWFVCGEHRKFGNVTENFMEEDCEIANQGTGQIEAHKVWLSSTEECEWYGVICSSDEVVRGVELIGNDLIGEIPPEISQLRFLQYLTLQGNCLYGQIPPEFGQMPNLLSLELHGNGLSGTIPPELNDASKIQLLNVAMQFQYAYQCQMSDGTLVNTLYKRGGTTDPVEYNSGLLGEVLGEGVNRWTSMKGLHLFDNSFQGDIHENIGDLKYLVFLRAHNNIFGGLLPNGLTKLKKLREMYLAKNEVRFDFPPDIGDMEDLEDIRVNENEMEGALPASLWSLKKLKKLWLQDTVECLEVEKTDANPAGWECDVTSRVGFTGSIPSEIGNLRKLSQLLIQNNPLEGTIPTEIGLCEELAILHMHKTNIIGSSPNELCQLRDKNLNNEANTGVFYSDCRPNNRTKDPFFECHCCTDCCDHTTKVCIADD